MASAVKVNRVVGKPSFFNIGDAVKSAMLEKRVSVYRLTQALYSLCHLRESAMESYIQVIRKGRLFWNAKSGNEYARPEYLKRVAYIFYALDMNKSLVKEVSEQFPNTFVYPPKNGISYENLKSMDLGDDSYLEERKRGSPGITVKKLAALNRKNHLTAAHIIHALYEQQKASEERKQKRSLLEKKVGAEISENSVPEPEATNIRVLPTAHNL